jgi:glycosyltransferase involved in cell wall biosynthesis
MASGRRSILVDARVNALPGAHGLARATMKLTSHLGKADHGLDLRVLINPRRDQLFPLSEIPAHADVITTDIALGAVHRCWELARLIRAVGAAVMYVPYPMFTPLIRPCPMVVTLHDCTIESSVDFAGGWCRQTVLRVSTSVVLRWAAAITTPTVASLEQIRRHYPRAPHPTLVPNGVDVEQFANVADENVAIARDRFCLPEQFVLTVGAHRPHKNHQILVRALAELPEHVCLVIVGPFDHSFPNPLPKLIDDLGLGSRVVLVPSVPDELLPAVYRAASVFAFPSLAEGCGIPVLEAMAAGVPVVASDIPALTEVCGSATLWVSPHDVSGWACAITKILEDPGMADSLTLAGAAVAVASGWEQGGRTLTGLLSSVAERGPDENRALRSG